MTTHVVPVDCHYQSPIGLLGLSFQQHQLKRLTFRYQSQGEPLFAPPQHIKHFLDTYFDKRPVVLQQNWLVPMPPGFAKELYETLAQIPFGEICTYGELAQRAGYTKHHARAAGQVMGKNPYPLFIPCHRVVASNFRLGGFSSGSKMKIALLKHEGFDFENPCAVKPFHQTRIVRKPHAL